MKREYWLLTLHFSSKWQRTKPLTNKTFLKQKYFQHILLTRAITMLIVFKISCNKSFAVRLGYQNLITNHTVCPQWPKSAWKNTHGTETQFAFLKNPRDRRNHKTFSGVHLGPERRIEWEKEETTTVRLKQRRPLCVIRYEALPRGPRFNSSFIPFCPSSSFHRGSERAVCSVWLTY